MTYSRRTMSVCQHRIITADGAAGTKADPVLPAPRRNSGNAVEGAHVPQQRIENDAALPRIRT